MFLISFSAIIVVAVVVSPDVASGRRALYAADHRPARARRPATAELKAVRYLSKEVPVWKVKHKCYSCHNNGDAARSLFAAKRLHVVVPEGALRDTSRWLQTPARWFTGGAKEPFKDKKLARLQFTLALAESVDADVIAEKAPLDRALAALVADQQADGSWKVDAGGFVGSPVTYGRTLATVLVHRVLTRFKQRKHAASIRLAERWMRKQKPESVFDAAALLWGLSRLRGPAAKKLEQHCRSLILRGQSRNGGWGPFVTSAPEPFDTSVVLLALAKRRNDPAIDRAVRRGRVALLNQQLADGGWAETTRPAKRESYAQRISTVGWALLALLASRGN